MQGNEADLLVLLGETAMATEAFGELGQTSKTLSKIARQMKIYRTLAERVHLASLDRKVGDLEGASKSWGSRWTRAGIWRRYYVRVTLRLGGNQSGAKQ